MDGSGNSWAAYYDLDGEFHVRNVTEDKDFQLGKEKGKAAEGMWWRLRQQYLYSMAGEGSGG